MARKHNGLIQLLSDKNLLSEDETLVLAEGLDKAVVGITTIHPKRVVYDYWKCVDVLMRFDFDLQGDPVDFDESLEFLDEYIEEITKLDEFSPIFIKPL
jgi:hypothetical protein